MFLDDELFLQKVVWCVVLVHTVSAYGAARVSSERGKDWVLPAAKVNNIFPA